MMKIILLTQRVDINATNHERRDSLDQRYSDYFASIGHTPYPVPNLPNRMPDMFDGMEISGLVLTGGNDLAKYGGNAPERDETEKKLIDYCRERRIPILGICRGMQVLGEYCVGATLVKSSKHVHVRHQVRGKINKITNSYHEWKIDPFQNSDYEVIAQTDNGDIEALRHVSQPIMGIMWHPEREDNIDITEQKLFKIFFDTGNIDI